MKISGVGCPRPRLHPDRGAEPAAGEGEGQVQLLIKYPKEAGALIHESDYREHHGGGEGEYGMRMHDGLVINVWDEGRGQCSIFDVCNVM